MGTKETLDELIKIIVGVRNELDGNHSSFDTRDPQRVYPLLYNKRDKLIRKFSVIFDKLWDANKSRSEAFVLNEYLVRAGLPTRKVTAQL